MLIRHTVVFPHLVKEVGAMVLEEVEQDLAIRVRSEDDLWVDFLQLST